MDLLLFLSTQVPVDDGTWEYRQGLDPVQPSEHTVACTGMAGMYSPQTKETLGWLSWFSVGADAAQIGLSLACQQKDCPVYEEDTGGTALATAGILATRRQTARVKYIDQNGVVRITIKRGSPNAPGSGDPHVHAKRSG